jgi:SpoVK/Ycf46/Vps4 family AAA+-type ATPase
MLKRDLINLKNFLEEKSNYLKYLFARATKLSLKDFNSRKEFELFLENYDDGFYKTCVLYFPFLYMKAHTFPGFGLKILFSKYNENFDSIKMKRDLKKQFKNNSQYIQIGYFLQKILLIEKREKYNIEIMNGAISSILIKMVDEIGRRVCQDVNKSEVLESHNSFIIRLENKKSNKSKKVQKSLIENVEILKDDNKNPIDELNGLIGMSQLKKDIQNTINLIRIQKMRAEIGINVIEMSHHLVFTGNPGTGKTSVARILAKIYKSLGLLSNGQLIETDRAGLVAGYLGQTALKTDEIIRRARGGILFIDEAYSLVNSGVRYEDTYGKEAIDTLLKRMEDYRDDLIVIVAGYEKEMRKFIQSNPGLESRFNKFFHFEDYNGNELTDIFISVAKERHYNLGNEVIEKLRDYFSKIYSQRDKNFSNGRFIRNFFEKVITNQANRIILLDSISEKDLTEITEDDILEYIS